MTKNKQPKVSRTILSNTSKSVFLGLSCLMLTTGCADSLTSYSGAEPQNRNLVEMVRVPYTIEFISDGSKITEVEVSKLNNFLATSNVTYGDEFSMDFPLDRNGNLSELDKERLSYMSNLLKDSGLYLSAILTPFGMEPSVNTGRLIISKYVVTTPDCGWNQPAYPNYNNAPTDNFGCATQANLGLMVANPRDLITGQEGSAPNAERTALAVQRYQNRVVTVSSASSTDVTN